MNLYAVSSLFAFLTVMGISLFVYLRNRQNQVNRNFGILGFTLAVWIFGCFVESFVHNPAIALMWDKVLYIGVICYPISFLNFIYSYMDLRKLQPLFWSCGAITIILLSLNFVDSLRTILITSVEKRFPFRFIAVPGPVWYITFSYVMSIAGFGLYLMLRNLLQTSEVGKKQRIKYLLLSYFILSSGGLMYFGLVFSIWSPPIDNGLAILFCLIMAYAIIRHQLMDIEVVIKRTLVFAGMALGMMAMIAIPTLVAQTWLAQTGKIHPMVLNLIGVALIMLTYERMKTWLVNITDKYLFQKKYDYKELLKKFTDEVLGIMDLKQLLQMTVNTLSETVKLESSSLLLVNKDTHKYELAASKGTNGQQLVLEEDEAFIKFLRQTHEPIGKDGELGKVRFPEEVTERLKQLNARLCLPLEVHEELIGVLCLGKKKSDEEFTKDDLDILLPLAKTLGIAISNAQLFDELAKTQAEVVKREKLALVGTLAAGLAHEIKNPLTPIKTFTESLETHHNDAEFRAKFQRIVGREVEKINHLVQQLLEFSKPMPSQLASVNLTGLLDETVELFSNELLTRRIQILRDYADEVQTPLMADSRQLRHVFVNLILNSLQAMDGSGGTLKLKAAVTDSHFVIQIEDSGCGIAPENLARIFEPFFTTKTKGTGLGLAVVQNVIQEHGGKITVESELNRGTTVTLYLPNPLPNPPTDS